MFHVQADVQYTRDVDHTQDKYSSIVFNAFIFLQLCNLINARKIKDELNVFRGERQCVCWLYCCICVHKAGKGWVALHLQQVHDLV